MALGPTKGPEHGDALEPADLRVSCQAGEESGSLRCWFTRGARAVRTSCELGLEPLERTPFVMT